MKQTDSDKEAHKCLLSISAQDMQKFFSFYARGQEEKAPPAFWDHLSSCSVCQDRWEVLQRESGAMPYQLRDYFNLEETVRWAADNSSRREFAQQLVGTWETSADKANQEVECSVDVLPKQLSQIPFDDPLTRGDRVEYVYQLAASLLLRDSKDLPEALISKLEAKIHGMVAAVKANSEDMTFIDVRNIVGSLLPLCDQTELKLGTGVLEALLWFKVLGIAATHKLYIAIFVHIDEYNQVVKFSSTTALSV